MTSSKPHVSCEKRRGFRVTVSSIVVHVSSLSEPISMHDVGPGGCLVHSTAPLRVGSEHQISVETSIGWSPALPVRVVRCQLLTRARGRQYAIGFEFLLPTAPPPAERQPELARA